MKKSEIIQLAIDKHLVVWHCEMSPTTAGFLCNAVALTHGHYTQRHASAAKCKPVCDIISDINNEIDSCFTMYDYLHGKGLDASDEACYTARIELANKLIEKYKKEETNEEV